MLVQFLAVMLAAQQAVPTPPPAPPKSPCADQEHQQFDFWVGKWDVYPTGKDKLVAHSLIEKVYDCGVRENWMPLSNQPGGSLNIYVPSQQHWEQFWIDSGGTRATFTGGWNGSAMVLTGNWQNSPAEKSGPLTRMTYSKNADGSVRQFGEQSSDEGKTWSASFDFTYRPSVAGNP